MSDKNVGVPLHHIKQEYCETRPKYRNGRKKTAVKVFTINLESKYLIVTDIPATGLEKDVVKLFSSQGVIQQCRELKDYPKEEFTQAFLVQYRDLQVAKSAKIKLDEHYFFGSMLHIFYAPEFETIADTREKIMHRLRSVTLRVKTLKSEEKMIAKSQAKKQAKKLAKAMKKENLPNNQPPSISSIPVITSVGSSISSHITPLPQGFVNSIPCNPAGIPLYLPPRPLPDITLPPCPPVMPSIPFSPSPNLPSTSNTYAATNQQPTKHPNPIHSRLNAKSHLKDQSSSGITNTSRNKVVKTKPRLKARSGYFYENVLHKLISQSTSSSLVTTTISKASTKLPSKSINTTPVEKPPFLPRHVELKQLDEINKIETLPGGEIPFLGSFIHEPPRNTS